MKNGHSRKSHTSLTEKIGNYPLFYPPQISQFDSPTISQTTVAKPARHLVMQMEIFCVFSVFLTA